MKRTWGKLVSAVIAAAMVFAVAAPVSAETASEEGWCGEWIHYLGVLGNAAGGNCSQQGGPSNCINTVKLHVYGCPINCTPGAYSGYELICTAGHYVGGGGFTIGKCIFYNAEVGAEIGAAAAVETDEYCTTTAVWCGYCGGFAGHIPCQNWHMGGYCYRAGTCAQSFCGKYQNFYLPIG